MSLEKTVDEILKRLTRVESRLVQLMLRMGMNPYEHKYDFPPPEKETHDEHR